MSALERLFDEAELTMQMELCRRLYNKALWWREGAYARGGPLAAAFLAGRA